MSRWTDLRDGAENKIEAVAEAIADPIVTKGITFLHDVEALVEAQGPGDFKAAVEDGATAAAADIGTIEQKLIAGLIAFGSALLGYGITIVKEAKAEVEAAPVTTPAA